MDEGGTNKAHVLGDSSYNGGADNERAVSVELDGQTSAQDPGSSFDQQAVPVSLCVVAGGMSDGDDHGDTVSGWLRHTPECAMLPNSGCGPTAEGAMPGDTFARERSPVTEGFIVTPHQHAASADAAQQPHSTESEATLDTVLNSPHIGRDHDKDDAINQKLRSRLESEAAALERAAETLIELKAQEDYLRKRSISREDAMRFWLKKADAQKKHLVFLREQCATGGSIEKLKSIQNQIREKEIVLRELKAVDVGLERVRRQQDMAVQHIEAKNYALPRKVSLAMAMGPGNSASKQEPHWTLTVEHAS
ncbi:hypothetical protein BESB_060690 [Besnoitia besnoiti]|uniref:Uncharacterized protein n=1 Tax=Besnoitia besnoiti TaxID=94643 RepID=A0A2A9MIG5_BESBE|nr:hypothetical protein BESB_060690 [Besnoitia besnoiti]PFH35182.1 hypothetical protein BESB_060690 [Besnoitia besnoiti]